MVIVRELERKLAEQGVPESVQRLYLTKVRILKKKHPGEKMIAFAYECEMDLHAAVFKNGYLNVDSNVLPEADYNSLSPNTIIEMFKRRVNSRY